MVPALAVLVLSSAVTQAPAQPVAPAPAGEARLSLDLSNAPVADLMRLIAELTGQQLVLDGDTSCRLTLRLSEVRWQTALEHSLRACGLASELEGGILRVAPIQRLIEEQRQRRALEDARAQARDRPSGPVSLQLSYARAEELAPVLQKLLGPGTEVTWDKRTNTLFIVSSGSR